MLENDITPLYRPSSIPPPGQRNPPCQSKAHVSARQCDNRSIRTTCTGLLEKERPSCLRQMLRPLSFQPVKRGLQRPTEQNQHGVYDQPITLVLSVARDGSVRRMRGRVTGLQEKGV